MDTSSLLIDAAAAVSAAYLLSRFFRSHTPPNALPLGPTPKLLIGNLNDLPPPGAHEWLFWKPHKELYGPLSCLRVLGQTIMIISDYKVAFDLLEKRSGTYSERPVLTFAGEMCGWEYVLAMTQASSDLWRASRKNIHQVLGTKAAVARFYPLQEVEARRFVFRVIEEPRKLLQHIRKEAGAIILSISYGYTIEPHGADPLVDLADQALAQFSIASQPGRWSVDALPFFRHVPSWIPGAGFKSVATSYKKTYVTLTEKPFAFTKKQIADGTAKPSYVADVLSGGDFNEWEEFVAKPSSKDLYSGGADTTVSSIHCFFLAMVLFPEVQKKAQEELDRILGADRLPSFADRPSLPYIDAVVKEVLRWHPVAPMGVPHVAAEDDVYNGMFIPKGTMLMPNIWLFMHDEDNYKDPHLFKPERFLGKEPELDPHMFSFGFGRRICPGRELADASIFLTIAVSLATLRIGKATDNTGNEIEPNVDFMPGMISHLAEFRCEIRPRSTRTEQLIRAVEDEHPWEEGDAAVLE